MAKAVGYGRTRRGNPERVLELAIAARTFGMISGALSMLIFLLLLVTYAPFLALNSGDLLEDVNLVNWRARFFTFNPSVFGKRRNSFFHPECTNRLRNEKLNQGNVLQVRLRQVS